MSQFVQNQILHLAALTVLTPCAVSGQPVTINGCECVLFINTIGQVEIAHSPTHSMAGVIVDTGMVSSISVDGSDICIHL